jgi:hypothetical protein
MRIFFLLRGICFGIALVVALTSSSFLIDPLTWAYCGLCAWWLDEATGDRWTLNAPARRPQQPVA